MKKPLSSIVRTIIIFAMLCITLTGCYDSREIDDMAYIVAIGLDTGKTNKLMMTLQLVVPPKIKGGDGGGGGDAEEGSQIITLEAPTIYSGLNMANNFISRQINLSHTKVLVFSEEFARNGIADLVIALPKGREFRPTVNILVAKGTAVDYIKSVKPELEGNPAKYYELNNISHLHTGFTADTMFHNFYIQSKSLSIQPVATLAGVSKYKSPEDLSLADSTYKDKGRPAPLEGDFKAGSLPKSGSVQSEIMGLAVFDRGKMVGELDGEQTMGYLMVRGKFNKAYVTMPDPIEKERFVILNIRQARKPNKNIKMVNDKPVIDIRIMLEGDITVIQSGINYESPEKMSILERGYEEFIKKGVSDFLVMTSKDFQSDICGLGSGMKKKFLTWDQWKDFKWLSRYKEATFNVSVDVKIRRPGLTIRSSPITSTEGEIYAR
ncbi:spore germination protein KC [Anaerobacterium chartisolvens]|uniref:Spore germination protein KC n=1 Tax=Anaerobacterium chartisolvens TaxID=1297424 RepID=A0A369BFP2_9FIRM|nr:Ger(x)C family spore germination protein [Anaerobacterium chartisolvens]RCX19428.1 spore germination protein KC [Anaerobacterium chartisolvens]